MPAGTGWNPESPWCAFCAQRAQHAPIRTGQTSTPRSTSASSASSASRPRTAQPLRTATTRAVGDCLYALQRGHGRLKVHDGRPHWHHQEVSHPGRLPRRSVGTRPPRRCVDQHHVRTEAGDPLQLGAELADRARPITAGSGELRRWLQFTAVSCGSRCEHGDVVTILNGGNRKVQGEGSLAAATLRVDDRNGLHAVLPVLGALTARSVHTSIVGGSLTLQEEGTTQMLPHTVVLCYTSFCHKSGIDIDPR